jgi:hypothetical protein
MQRNLQLSLLARLSMDLQLLVPDPSFSTWIPPYINSIQMPILTFPMAGALNGSLTRTTCVPFFLRTVHHSSWTSSYRSIRNLIIDLRQIPASTSAVGLHWQVSQGTSLINIVVEMSTASNNNHQGMFMENGR